MVGLKSLKTASGIINTKNVFDRFIGKVQLEAQRATSANSAIAKVVLRFNFSF